MRRIHTIAFAGAAIMAASPSLATIADPNPITSGPITFSSGTNSTINFGGTDPGTSSTLYLTLTGVTAGTGTQSGDTLFDFTYQLVNTSNLALNPFGRVSGFGFDDATTTSSGATLVTDSTVAGVNGFTDIINGANISGGNNKLDFCLTDQQCSGGASGGATVGNSANGTFELVYSGALTSVTLGDFMVRYQSTTLNGNGSGTGDPIGGVPEPATWGMMLLGFGGIGMVMRRRRGNATESLAQIA